MVFRDVDDNIVRIPNGRLCGIMRNDNSKCYVFYVIGKSEKELYYHTMEKYDAQTKAVLEGKE